MTSQNEKIAESVDRIRLMIGRMRPHHNPIPPSLRDVDAIHDLVHKYDSFAEITRETGLDMRIVRNTLIRFAAKHDGTKTEKKA